MLSTLKITANDPHDVLEIAPDVVLAARVDQQPSAHDAASLAPDVQSVQAGLSPAASAPRLDTAFRAAAADRLVRLPGQRSRWVARFVIGFLFALGSAVGMAAWQTHGDEARQTMAKWLPHFFMGSAPPADSAGTVEQASAPAAAATAAAAEPAAPEGATAAAAATLPADSAQLLQSMAHDLASVGQQIEQMKASIVELKARQEQMSREIARASEQNLRPRVTAPATPPAAAHAPRAAVAPLHRQTPPRQSVTAAPYVPPPPPEPQAAAAPPATELVPRPPMPVQ